VISIILLGGLIPFKLLGTWRVEDRLSELRSIIQKAQELELLKFCFQVFLFVPLILIVGIDSNIERQPIDPKYKDLKDVVGVKTQFEYNPNWAQSLFIASYCLSIVIAPIILNVFG